MLQVIIERYKIKDKLTYSEGVGAGTVEMAYDGRLGCRCDDVVVYSPDDDYLMLVDHRQETVGLS